MTDPSSDVQNLTPMQRALLVLKEMKAKLDAMQQASREPIAIVGMSCRFPGGVGDPQAYWRLLRDGVDAITEVPAARWDIDEYYDPDPDAPGRMCTRRGGFIEGVDLFDPQFFGIAPREAVSMDPQQRLFLEVSWEALERAGIAPDRLNGSRTGVFLGICGSDYASLRLKLGDPGRVDAHSGSGAAVSIASGRLSYLLGLQGPSLSVDTACSASLVAVHLACQSLRNRESDLALAAGVNVILLPDGTVGFSRARMMAPDGRCKTFDARADGYVRGEGCGVVVLKRLSQALTEGDPILATIRGSAVNQDGRSGGLTAPNGRAQEAVVREALTSAGLEPAAIDYVEAHGTGTSLGDPIEVRALGSVLGRGRSKDMPLLIGSVKTNIGHLEAAAGVASLIKVALALQHGEIPPSLHFETPNPYVPWDELPVAVVTTQRPWPRRGARRTAGVSSFGFSGTNAHVIMEEPPPLETVVAQSPERPLHLLTLSARTEQALRELAKRYQDHFASSESGMLANACHTVGIGRAHLEHRAAVVARSLEEAGDRLRSLAADRPAHGVVIGQAMPGTQPKVAFLFTGQGAQYVGMGRELYETQPTFRQTLDRCAEALRPHLEHPLLAVMWGEAGPAGLLDQTGYTQPALFALEVALATLWQSWGVTPTWVLGHSVGEVAAAVVAGALTLEDGGTLIATRARLMQALPPDGAMVAVAAPAAQVQAACVPYAAEVSLAAVNGPASVVLSGRRAAVAQVVQTLTATGVRTTPLAVSHAFHSPLMEPMLAAFEQVAAGAAYAAPRCGLVSNLTGQPCRPGDLDAAYWRRHVRAPVQFQAGILALQAQGVTCFLEVGPHPVLCGLGPQCLPAGTGTWLPTLRKGRPAWDTVLATLAALYVRGVEVDWAAFDRPYPRRKVSLPTYPFQRERYWHEDADVNRQVGRTLAAAAPAVLHPLLGHRVRAAHRDRLFENQVGVGATAYLRDHAFYGQAVFPAAAYLEMALAAGAPQAGGGAAVLEDVAIEQPLFLPDGKAPTVQCVLDPTGGFQVCSLADAAEERWQQHATGRVGGPGPGEPDLAPGTAPAAAGLDAARARCQQPQEVSAYYERFRALGVEYGPAFRGIEAVWSGDGEAVGDLSLPAAAGDATGYRLHPALLDAGFQVLGAAYGRRDSGDDVYMPTHLKRLTVRGAVGRRAWAHAVVQAAPGTAASLSGAIRLFDEAGRLVAEVEGLELRRVTRAALERGQPKPYLEWLYEVTWEEKALDGAAPLAGERVVVLRGQDDLGGQLSQRLRDRGAIVAEITAGEDETLEARLREAGGDAPCRVVALGAVEAPEADAAPLLQTARTVCGGTLRLVQALARRQAPARLYLVTRGAQAVGEAPAVAPAQAALWGLGRTVALEHPELAGVRVDLDPGRESEKDADALAAELGAGDGEDQVAYRGGKRFVARLVRVQGRGPTTPAPEDGQALQLQIATRGVLDNLKLVTVNRRVPGKGEVEIQVEAAGLNFRDVLNALGMYPGDPGLLGGECAGRIVAVGEGVEALRVGESVVGLAAGGLSSYVTTAARLVTRVPRGVSVEEGATIPMVFLTAHYGLNHLARMKRGERVLIHAAAGGVGMAAVQLAQRAGAEIFATAGSPKKRDVLRSMGVPHVMDSRSLAFAEEVMTQTRGEGIDIVLNALADEFIPKSLSLLRQGGRFLEIGKRGIWDPEQVRRVKPEIAYHVIYLGEVVEQQPTLIQEMLRELREAFEAGHLAPLPRTVFSLRDAASAFRYMAQAKHIGKVVLRQDLGRGRIVPDATYLVTGGLGSLGLVVAEWLVAEGAQHLVLVGRHGPGAAAQTALAEWARRGVQVQVRQADVAHAEEVQALVASLRAQPPLRGIIHAAGVLDDGVLLQQSWERFARVLAPKALGAWHLHQATAGMDLDFFVLFSSVAAVLGSAGQGNYAAANAYLDGLAWYRRSRGLPALSLNWGPWGEVGMAAQLAERAQSRRAAGGVALIPPALGVQALGYALASGAPQWTVLPIAWPGFLGRFPAGEEPPLFRRMGADATRAAAPPPQEAAGAMRRRLAEAPASERAAVLLAYVRAQVARVLGLDPSHPPSDKTGLAEMGMDSLMAVELRNRLQGGLTCSLPSTLMFEYPTITALVDCLTQEMACVASGALPGSDVSSDTAGSVGFIDSGGARHLLQGVGDIPDDQVEALLRQMLSRSGEQE